MLPTKFGINWPFSSGEEAKNRFSWWRPWRPSWISDRNEFSYFWLISHPNASYQVSSQLAQGCRRSRLLKQLLTPHDGRRTTHDGLTYEHPAWAKNNLKILVLQNLQFWRWILICSIFDSKSTKIIKKWSEDDLWPFLRNVRFASPYICKGNTLKNHFL